MRTTKRLEKSLSALALVVALSAPALFAGEPIEALGKKVMHESTSVLSGWGDSSGRAKAVSRPEKDNSGVELEDVNGDDGRRGHKEIRVGEFVVDRMPPGTFDESHSVESYDDEDGNVIALIYGDKGIKMNRVNGFPTDIPYSAKIERVEVDGDKALVIWRSAEGQLMVLEVESLQNRTSKFYYTGDPKKSHPYGGGSSNSNGSDVGETGSNGTGSTASNDSQQTPPPVVIPEPGNSYGIDPVLTDAEVEMAAQEAIELVRSSYHAPAGMVRNEWGVLVGNGISHSGGIEGYDTPLRYWMMTDSSVRSAVEMRAQEIRKSYNG